MYPLSPSRQRGSDLDQNNVAPCPSVRSIHRRERKPPTLSLPTAKGQRPPNRFFDRDHTLVANFLYRIGEKLADLNIAIGGNRTDLGDLGVANRHFGPGLDIRHRTRICRTRFVTPSLAARVSIERPPAQGLRNNSRRWNRRTWRYSQCDSSAVDQAGIEPVIGPDQRVAGIADEEIEIAAQRLDQAHDAWIAVPLGRIYHVDGHVLRAPLGKQGNERPLGDFKVHKKIRKITDRRTFHRKEFGHPVFIDVDARAVPTP